MSYHQPGIRDGALGAQADRIERKLARLVRDGDDYYERTDTFEGSKEVAKALIDRRTRMSEEIKSYNGCNDCFAIWACPLTCGMSFLAGALKVDDPYEGDQVYHRIYKEDLPSSAPAQVRSAARTRRELRD
jgi:hypothetical protein